MALIDKSGDSPKVLIGGDSAGVAGLDITLRKDSKVFVNGDMVIGYTTSFRLGQLLRFNLKPPCDHYDDPYEYMCTDFINCVRTSFKEGGYINVENSREEGGLFIVGYKGRIFVVDSDFQVGESHDDYAAVGCGWAYALGSLYMTEYMTEMGAFPLAGTDRRVELALSAAEKFSGGVRSPFVYEWEQ